MAINGISQMGQDPNMYAQMYAQQNGLSVDDAKAQLKEKYGDPQQSGQSGLGLNFGSQNQGMKPSSFNDPEFSVDSDFSIQGMFQNLLNRLHGNDGPQKPGDPQRQQDTSTQLPSQGTDPDTYAQQYADENGLSLEEAKAELKSKYGDPQKPDNNSNTTANNKNKLPDQGTDPNSYAQEYADENGLTLDAAIEQLNELYGTPIQKNMFFNA